MKDGTERVETEEVVDGGGRIGRVTGGGRIEEVKDDCGRIKYAAVKNGTGRVETGEVVVGDEEVSGTERVGTEEGVGDGGIIETGVVKNGGGGSVGVMDSSGGISGVAVITGAVPSRVAGNGIIALITLGNPFSKTTEHS